MKHKNYFVEGIIWNGFERLLKYLPNTSVPIFKLLKLEKDRLGQYGSTQPLSQYVNFYEEGAKLTRNFNFGMQIGALVKPMRAGLPGLMCLYSKTLEDAIVNLGKSLPTLIQGVDISLVKSDEGPMIFYRLLDEKIEDHRQFDEHSLAFIVSMLRGIVGRRWTPKEVHIAHSLKGTPHFYKRFFRTKVLFDQPHNVIILRPSDLDLKGRHYNPFLLNTFKYYARKDLQDKINDLSLIDQTTFLIEEGLLTGIMDSKRIAGQLSMSPRTFNRTLKNEGFTFRELLEKVRMGRARKFLQESKLQISVISEKLGYSETSAFTRAFTKSQGLSPSEFRKQKN